MITNEERREVAARLRKNEPSSFGSLFDVWREIALAVNPSGGSYKTLPLELADLIEPDPERTCKMELVKRGPIYSVWRFSCCGYEHSENMTDGGATELPGTRCPKCGAVVNE